MEFYVDREPFLKILGRIQTVVERRNTMPILGNVLLEAADGVLTASATDLDVSLKTRCPAEIEQSGALTVAARKLFEIVRELPDKPLRLRRDGQGRLALSCDRARFTLAALPTEEFPAIPGAEGTVALTLPVDALADMFARTHFAMSTDEGRYNLNGILLQVEPPKPEESEGLLRMAATDTHRLAIVEKRIGETVEELQESIVPKKAVIEARKLLEEGGEEVQLFLGERHLALVLPEITLVSKLVEGRFPNYKRVVPSDNKQLLNIHKESLLSVVKRMSVLSNEKSRGIRIQIDADTLKVSTTNPEQEAAEEEMSAEFDGDAMALGFNARYLQEILAAVDGETVRFHLKDEESSVLVTDPGQDHFLFVLMPMRV